MRATEIELPGVGDPESLRVRTRDLPEPAAGQAIVRVEASGVSFAEQQMRLGKYYDQPSFPFVPGYDLVGVVEQIGDGDSEIAVGQRVAALTKIGGWADLALVDVRQLAAVPDGVEPEAAETVVVNGVTAWRMLHRTARRHLLLLGSRTARKLCLTFPECQAFRFRHDALRLGRGAG